MRETFTEENINEVPESTSYDMTKGKILPEITRFAVPLIFSFIFQQCYTLIDAVIVSRSIGVMAMAAIGAVDWLDYLMLGIILGMSEAYTAVIARFFGEKNLNSLRKSMGMIVVTAVALFAIITLWQVLFLSKAIAALKIPAKLAPMSSTYCHIYYSGCAAVIFYNVEGSILRGIGDSKTPLGAIVISSLVNIVLDLFFILKLGTGVGGAAVATVISQVVSGLYCLYVINKKNAMMMPRRDDFKIDHKLIKMIVLLAAPILFENVIVAMSGLLVQRVADGFGSVYLAGYVATNRMYDLLNIMGLAFGAAVATFVGQNYGAGKIDRIHKGVRETAILLIIISIAAGIFFYSLRKYIVGIFIDPGETGNMTSLHYGMYFMALCAAFLWALYLGQLFRFALQGVGRTIPMLLSGIAGFAVRAGIAIIVMRIDSRKLLFFDEPIAWVGELIFLFLAYEVVIRKINEREV